MRKLYQKLPNTPGVYLMKSANGKLLYIGKAGNLKRRVSSYFLRPHDLRIEKLVEEIKKIDYKKTDTALEALILESALIKKFQPSYNIREKDNKSFLCVEITKEKFPRVLLVRAKGRDLKSRNVFGPFVSATGIQNALKIIRKIFPFSIHKSSVTRLARRASESRREGQVSGVERKRGCFDYQIGLCPGVCIGAISRPDYLANIKNIRLILHGKKKRILASLKNEMKKASHNLDYEKAGRIKRQIFALKHIQDTALISDGQVSSVNGQVSARIEGYDISNISGTSAVGSMVVFIGGEPARGEYKKFKINTISEPNDVGMLKEVLRRRFAHQEWGIPDVILIDGGKGQVNGAKSVLDEFGLRLPVVGIAKGPERKKNEFIGSVPKNIGEKTLIRVRDEAHRFAIGYHKKLRSARLFE